MSWKWSDLFEIRSEPHNPKKKENDYKVEHYPISGLYFPKVNYEYMDTPGQSGVIRLVDKMIFGDSFDNPEDAWIMIDKYIEQSVKPTVTVIRR